MTQQKSVAEILPDIVKRLETARNGNLTWVPLRDLLQDALDVIQWINQPYPPSKYSRAQFLELRDCMHEALATDGEFGGLTRFVPPRVEGMPPEENVMAFMILDALTTAALEQSARNAVLSEVIKRLEKEGSVHQATILDAIEVVIAMKTPSAGG